MTRGMTKNINIVFFGSFTHYSAYILESFLNDPEINVLAVVTTPPLIDKKGTHKNPVHVLAESSSTAVLTPEVLTKETLQNLLDMIAITDETSAIDYFVTAGYGKLLPKSWLEHPKIASLNLHFSLLPEYRGANPGEWSILRGESATGVTLIEMSPKFDTGNMVARSATTIDEIDTRETLYDKLYLLGADVLPTMLKTYNVFRTDTINATKLQQEVVNATELHLGVLPDIQMLLPPEEQQTQGYFYARRLGRDDGYVSWDIISTLLAGRSVPKAEWPALFREVAESLPAEQTITLPELLERATRALAGFPTLWTEVPTAKGSTRMKILSVSFTLGKLVLDTVHLAGKQPTRWKEIKNNVL